MQRNSELAKEILESIIIEDHGGGGLYREEIHAVFEERYPDREPGRFDRLEYHLSLLVSGGFLTFTPDDKGNRKNDNFEMTWAGHDFVQFGLAN
ncbi:DUF2513 domain-containing protein [Pseudomonas anuradhapurensis]|uniref:hypothetical protein n=1 Tax=Pseudomonas anuradhapurensis TaxID=485870 RepID=UPI001644F66C|nr:hypothetical protein [Pseudomonas anuradhapurensis]QXI49148.1 DUF2513 domain-containing protein [Pseudomonas anuradhapurensis]